MIQNLVNSMETELNNYMNNIIFKSYNELPKIILKIHNKELT